MAEEIRSEEIENGKKPDAGVVEKNTPCLPKFLPAGKTIGIFSCILVVSVLISVLLTFSLTANYSGPQVGEAAHRLNYISELIAGDAYYDYDDEVLIEAALDAYVGALNDDYAEYYNKKEYADFLEDAQGAYVGIGITVQISETNVLGNPRSSMKIVGVSKGSSAEKAGLLTGDHILAVVENGAEITLEDITYDEMISRIKGKAGTTVTLSVMRQEENEYVVRKYTVERMEVVYESVTYEKSTSDPSIGVITISKFDLRTSELLNKAMDALIAEGIQKFIFDLRDNPGGDLGAVVACASYFLEKDDLILTKESKSGSSVVYRATVRSGVKESDIGKYRDYSYVLLINGNTASAAEILTSVFRDYSLGTLVGEKTFGKGIVQTIYRVGNFGAVKFTTALYYPPSGECYHGVGIEPNIPAITAEEQMNAALGAFGK